MVLTLLIDTKRYFYMTHEEKMLKETISKLEDRLLPEYGQKFDPDTRKQVKTFLKKLYRSAFDKGKQWSEEKWRKPDERLDI